MGNGKLVAAIFSATFLAAVLAAIVGQIAYRRLARWALRDVTEVQPAP